MFLSYRKSTVLSKLLQTLAEPAPEHEIRSQVGKLMLDLLNADYLASFTWNGERKEFEGRISINMSDTNLDAYEKYYQFVDPITGLLQVRRGPTLVSQVMPQEELTKTEFFNDFLAKDGLYWGVNMYSWVGNQNIGDLRIWRGKTKDNFDENDLQIMQLLLPVLTTSLQRARTSFGVSAVATSSVKPEKNLILASSLSEREYEIVELASKGLSDKEIARQLGICFTTVRTHINSAFRKLRVNNRVKLIQMFGE